ncbi:MAG: EamA family transporter [Lachnospiraceae bacterium]|nr:EamA family transporter [Lachnospiraceae bacterium]
MGKRVFAPPDSNLAHLLLKRNDEMLWIILVLIYGIIKGLREVLKKKALERNTTLEVLLMYTILSFLIVTPEIRNAGGVEPKVLLFVAVKSLTIFFAWRCGFEALSKLPVSLFGVLDLARVAFSMLLGMIVLHETMGFNQIAGLVLVVAGLLLLQRQTVRISKLVGGPAAARDSSHSQSGSEKNTDRSGHRISFFVILALSSSLLNAVSALFDKLLMTHTAITDGQLQFWYMLFLTVYYLLFALFKTVLTKDPSFVINWRSAIRNYWIWILAVLFVIADRCLFIANADPASKVTVMTLIKQSGVIFAIICGKFMFREKNTGYRMVCALIILAGIFISVLQ